MKSLCNSLIIIKSNIAGKSGYVAVPVPVLASGVSFISPFSGPEAFIKKGEGFLTVKWGVNKDYEKRI